VPGDLLGRRLGNSESKLLTAVTVYSRLVCWSDGTGIMHAALRSFHSRICNILFRVATAMIMICDKWKHARRPYALPVFVIERSKKIAHSEFE